MNTRGVSMTYIDGSTNRKWHCGTGGTRRGKMNYEDALRYSACYIRDCMIDYPHMGPGRTKQFEKFREVARQGDIIFLHNKLCGGVTHWGIFTGEIQSHREGFTSPPPNTDPSGWREMYGNERLEGEFHILVHGWNKIETPFEGSGIQKTLYECDY